MYYVSVSRYHAGCHVVIRLFVAFVDEKSWKACSSWGVVGSWVVIWFCLCGYDHDVRLENRHCADGSVWFVLKHVVATN